VTKTRAWRFDENEATIETPLGPADVEDLDVEFHVIQRAYPSTVGRFLSYESPDDRIAHVEERCVRLSDGTVIRLVISGRPAPTSPEIGTS
jgi:hypothetical protein